MHICHQISSVLSSFSSFIFMSIWISSDTIMDNEMKVSLPLLRLGKYNVSLQNMSTILLASCGIKHRDIFILKYNVLIFCCGSRSRSLIHLGQSILFLASSTILQPSLANADTFRWKALIWGTISNIKRLFSLIQELKSLACRVPGCTLLLDLLSSDLAEAMVILKSYTWRKHNM